MDFVCLRHEILYMSRQLHHFQNVCDFAGDVGHYAVRRKESTVGKDDFPAAQKFITEQRLIDICAIKPDGRV